MEENPYKAPKADLTAQQTPRRNVASGPLFVGAVLGAFVGGVCGLLMAPWIVSLLTEGPDISGKNWSTTVLLSLVFGSMAGASVADYRRRRR
jgi:hypothetical protein